MSRFRPGLFGKMEEEEEADEAEWWDEDERPADNSSKLEAEYRTASPPRG